MSSLSKEIIHVCEIFHINDCFSIDTQVCIECMGYDDFSLSLST